MWYHDKLDRIITAPDCCRNSRPTVINPLNNKCFCNKQNYKDTLHNHNLPAIYSWPRSPQQNFANLASSELGLCLHFICQHVIRVTLNYTHVCGLMVSRLLCTYRPSLHVQHILWNVSSGNIQLTWFNTLRPRQNGRHFADDTFK